MTHGQKITYEMGNAKSTRPQTEREIQRDFKLYQKPPQIEPIESSTRNQRRLAKKAKVSQAELLAIEARKNQVALAHYMRRSRARGKR